MPHAIRSVVRQVHAAGAAATHVAGVVLYGTRRTPDVDSGDATPARAAIGIGLHSVWNGPRKVTGGPPVLKRNKPT